MTKLLYGKNYTYGNNGVLGQKGQLLTSKNKLTELNIIVMLDEVYQDLPVEPKGSGKPCTGTKCNNDLSRDEKQIRANINAMAKHARSKGICCQIK